MSIHNPRFVLAKTDKRIASIDVFRAFIMFLMIFVNDLWSVKGVPHWMGHAAFDEDMLGLSDIVFPAFLFILGMSIPLAIGGRLAKNQSKISIIRHIFLRSFALLLMGLFSVNIGNGISEAVNISRQTFSLVMVVCFFIIWNNYPKTKNKYQENFRAVFKIIAWVTLLVLVFIYRDPLGGYFHPRWWGILGLIGWTYFICALIYLFFGSNWVALGIWNIFFTFLCITSSNEWLGIFSNILPGNGCFHAFTMSGLLLSLAFNRSFNRLDTKKKMIYASGVAILYFIIGWLSNKTWIISKLQESPPWLFYCTSISIFCYLFFYWVCDIKNKTHLFNIIKSAGTSTLTCYLIPSVLYSLFILLDFKWRYFTPENLWGLLKCILFALLVIGITGFLERVGVKLKI